MIIELGHAFPSVETERMTAEVTEFLERLLAKGAIELL
jgi:hypothetical protein